MFTVGNPKGIFFLFPLLYLLFPLYSKRMDGWKDVSLFLLLLRHSHGTLNKQGRKEGNAPKKTD